MITNISNTPNINRTTFTPVKIQTNSFRPVPKYDEVSFSGNIIKTIYQTKDTKEVCELVKLFHISLEHSIEGKMPQQSKSWLVNKLQNIMCKIIDFPYVWTAKQSDALTEVVRGENNKLLGGYSMIVEKPKHSAFVGFMTIAPELKKTKASREIILKMAERIYDNAKANDVHFISGSVNVENKSIRNTLKKLNVIETKQILNETEYEFMVEDLKKALDKLRNTKS